jgi:hypothetical protein
MTKLGLVAIVACMIGYSSAAVAVEDMQFACWDDFYKYCPTVPVDRGRDLIVRCLRTKKITNHCRQSMNAWLAMNQWAR